MNTMGHKELMYRRTAQKSEEIKGEPYKIIYEYMLERPELKTHSTNYS